MDSAETNTQQKTGDFKWYVLHVYAGFENKVKQTIEERSAQEGLQENFDRVLVPTEEVIEVKKAKRSRQNANSFRVTFSRT